MTAATAIAATATATTVAGPWGMTMAAAASPAVAGPWRPFVGWLEETSLQAVLLVLLILALRAVLRDRLAPRWRYALWLVLVVRLALPWAPQSGWSLYNLVPAAAVHGERARDAGETPAPQGEHPRESDGNTFVVPALAGNHSPGSVPANRTVGRFPAKAGTTDVVAPSGGPRTPSMPTGNGTVEGGPAEAGTTNGAVASGTDPGTRFPRLVSSLPGLLFWVPFAWLAGALALLAVVLAQSAGLARAIRRRPALADWATMDLLAECRATMGIRGYLLVYETPDVRTPALFGFLRPRLLLPEGAVAELGPERLRHVFLHELAHLRRRDVAMNWVVTLLQICHWFNPLVWVAFHRMRADRELACDALVLSRVAPEEVPAYGRTIIHLMETFSSPDSNRLPNRLSSSASLAGVLEDRHEAQRRIRGVAGYRKNTVVGTILGVLLVAGLAVVALTNAQYTTVAGAAPGSARPPSGNAGNASGGLYVAFGDQPRYLEMDRLPGKEPVILKDLPDGKGQLVLRVNAYRGGGTFLFEEAPNGASAAIQYGQPWTPYAEVLQSPTVPGDLDLLTLYENEPPSPKTPYTPGPAKPQRLPRPVTSYLHRMTDPRVSDYFRLSAVYQAVGWGQSKQSDDSLSTVTLAQLDLATRMVADAPQDPFMRVFLLDALVVRRDGAGLRRELDEWRARVEERPILHTVLSQAEASLRSIELTQAGRNGFDLQESLFRRQPLPDLPTVLRTLPDVLHCDEYASFCPPLSGPWDYFVGQVRGGSLAVQASAEMALLGGQRERALDLAVASYHLGQLMSQDRGLLIQGLWGLVVRSIADEGLTLYVLNGCERPEEVQAAWQRLEWLNEREKPLAAQDLLAREAPADWFDEAERAKSPFLCRLSEETLIRHRFADARFQLVRMAASAWYCRLKNGQFPKSANQFELLPGGTPPSDPFGEGPLRFVERPDALVCYSVGPNGQDEAGSVAYDPSNGTKSGGDITLEVPRERKYPFAREGVKARDKADLMRQFPNGLPPDPFRSTGHPPLGATDTIPVAVYSKGPAVIMAPNNAEGPIRNEGQPVLPLITYDPTNGSNSLGEIWLAVPTPGPAARPVGRPR